MQVVHLAGRCAEKLVMGEGELTGMGAPDLFHSNMIAREMVRGAGLCIRQHCSLQRWRLCTVISALY